MAKDSSKAPKKGKKAYLNDFQPNLAGEYTYTGVHYRYTGESYKQFRRTVLVLTAALAAGVLAPGFVRAGGMGDCFYVLIPYMAEAIAAFVSIFAIVKMNMGGEKLREYIYQKTVVRLPISLMCCAVFAAVGFVCSFIFSAINGVGGSTAEAAVLIVGKMLGIAAPLALRKYILGSVWEKEH